MIISAFVVISLYLILLLVIAIRNKNALQYKKDLIEKVYYVNISDLSKISNSEDLSFYKDMCKWRWKCLEKARYNKMVFEFWKPLDSFYTDKSFIRTLDYKSQNASSHYSLETVH